MSLVCIITIAVLISSGQVQAFTARGPRIAPSNSMTGSRITTTTKPLIGKNQHYHSTNDRSRYNFNLGIGFSAPSGASSDRVIREFERKEAQAEKRREAAMAELSKYEDTLKQIQEKKQEYLAASQVAAPPVGGTFSETTMRSAAKAFCWRILAGSVTFITTLKFSASVQTAFKVVGADFFSKAFTMFIGERLMNKSQAGRKAGSDGAGRSLMKALIWRLFAICNTLTMAVFVAKDISIASKIASTDAVFKTALMFVYERVWARINWGKEYLIEFSI